MKVHIDATVKALDGLKTSKLLGGFESNFDKKIEHGKDADKVYLKSIELQTKNNSRRQLKSLEDVRASVVDALCNFLNERFKCDDKLLQKIHPFIKFDSSTDIEEIHSLLAPDLSLPALYTQFNDFSDENSVMKNISLNQIMSKLCNTDESRTTYNELITVFARIAACTPHSADVERLISANNLLKTKLRSSMLVETENKYMYIHMNMPVLAQWNPTAAAILFINEKLRRKRVITTDNKTTKRQTVFKGVFCEAQECKNGDDDGDDETCQDTRNTIFEF